MAERTAISSKLKLTVSYQDHEGAQKKRQMTFAHLKPSAEPESITADGSVKRGCGLALFNVLQRIHFFYGEDSGMRVKSQEGVGTQVIVELNGEPHEPAPLTV